MYDSEPWMFVQPEKRGIQASEFNAYRRWNVEYFKMRYGKGHMAWFKHVLYGRESLGREEEMDRACWKNGGWSFDKTSPQ